MILYEYFRSSAAFRVRIALNLKGLQAERRYIHLANGEQRTADYRAVNPQALVPYLIDADVAVGQSLAIIEYLDEVHPQPPLLPGNAKDRAFVRSIAQLIACDIHPINNLRVLNYLTEEFRVDNAARDRWYCHWIREGFQALEKILAQRTTQSRFCFGESPTLADICLVPQVANAKRFKCALDAFPLIAGIYAHAMIQPAFAAADPAKQADYPKSTT